MTVLAINCGSSSLKFALFDGERAEMRGTIDRIGHGGVEDHAAAVDTMFGRLPAMPRVVGHRLVHGGPDRFEPVRIDAAVRAELAAYVPLAPLHLPIELRAIDAVAVRLGDVPQVACFDTAFHRTIPEVARRFALPAELYDAGVRRYGFHGLSYELVASTFGSTPPHRAIFAHLGNGASMVAVRDGRALDTTMAFTPAAGLVMGTRSGDLDPGIIVYLLDHLGYDARRVDELVNRRAGLLGISGTTADMRDLLERRDRNRDPHAALAIEIFCYRARMWIGALAAVLGGLDMLVFTGGIGEHAPTVRAQICDGLDHLGVGSLRCPVTVVATDEERVIARHARRIVAS